MLKPSHFGFLLASLIFLCSIGRTRPWILRGLSRSIASIRRTKPRVDRPPAVLSPNTTNTDEFFLRLALKEAYRAAREDEVPIGALVVSRHNQRVLARQHNRVEQRRDATAHAEVLALRQAARRSGNWRLYNTTLYSTVEPCVMCCAAAQAFRVDRIVYGAPDRRLGGIVSHVQLLNVTHPYHTIENVQGGVCAEECGSAMRDFFRDKRKQKRKDHDRTTNKGKHNPGR